MILDIVSQQYQSLCKPKKLFSVPITNSVWLSPFAVYLDKITRNNKAAGREAALTGKSSLCMCFIVLEVSLQSCRRNRRARRVIAGAGGGKSTKKGRRRGGEWRRRTDGEISRGGARRSKDG